jgi:hypothetical protein
MLRQPNIKAENPSFEKEKKEFKYLHKQTKLLDQRQAM